MAKARATTSTAARERAEVRVQERQVENTRILARYMDDLVKVPGTNIGLGLDALLGLFPGIGDSIGTVLSGYIMVEAVRRRVPIPVLLRMAANLGFDTVLGTVPFVGDFFDVAFRANRMNAQLLERTPIDPERLEKSSAAYLLAAVTIVVVTMVVLLVAAAFTIWLILQFLSGLGSVGN